MSKPILKKQKVISDISSQTFHISDIRQLIAYHLSFKDQVRLNRITKVCQDQIKHNQRKTANELYNLIKTKKQYGGFYYTDTLCNDSVELFNGYSPFIVNTMDGRSFETETEAEKWFFTYKIPPKPKIDASHSNYNSNIEVVRTINYDIPYHHCILSSWSGCAVCSYMGRNKQNIRFDHNCTWNMFSGCVVCSARGR